MPKLNVLPNRIAPPDSLACLIERAQGLAGATLGEIAQQFDFPVPALHEAAKGWTGQLLEWVLGATAGSRPIPDFPELGVELKTLPVNRQGKPRESTFVCVVSLQQIGGQTWLNSSVYQKLRCVLWVPYWSEPEVPLLNSVLGHALLWQPCADELASIQQDWEMFAELIALGRWDQITGRLGQDLQIRPKGADSKALCEAFDATGRLVKTLPRGFYLRAQFTHALMQRYFAFSSG